MCDDSFFLVIKEKITIISWSYFSQGSHITINTTLPSDTIIIIPAIAWYPFYTLHG